MKSNYLNSIKFILCILIICIHSSITVELSGINVTAETFPLFYYFQYFVCEILSRIAVPLFFVISGYLFFPADEPLDIKCYTNKLKRRVKSLIIPYICWNSIYIIIRVFENLLHPISNSPLVWNWGALDYFYAFWSSPGGNTPIDGSLWYIKSLFLVFLFSPVIYYLLRKIGIWCLLLFGICWFLGLEIPIITTTAVFFVSIGAFIKIRKIQINGMRSFIGVKSIVLFILLSFVSILSVEKGIHQYINRLAILSGMIAFIWLTEYAYKNNKLCIPEFMAESSFFIYAYHYKFVVAYIYVLTHLLPVPNSLILFTIFFSSVVIFTFGGVIAYKLMRRYTPKLLSILTGGRIS